MAIWNYTTMTSQITSLTIGYSTFYSGADQRKYQSSASLAFVLEIHRWPMNSTHKGPVTRKMFPFDDIIMNNVNGKLWSKGYLALAWPRVGFGGEVDTGRHCREKARVVVRSLATSLRLFLSQNRASNKYEYNSHREWIFVKIVTKSCFKCNICHLVWRSSGDPWVKRD